MNKQWLGWLARGAAMGIADAVPGVSGGTIALITGIYERFIGALASFKPSLFRYIQARDWRGLWKAIDGTFLLCVGSGILLSLFSALTLMSQLLEIAAPLVWAFFSGVILYSIVHFHQQKNWPNADLFALFIGIAIATILSVISPTQLEPTAMFLVLGGMVAISAMMLPGISGSFMLVLLGLYQPITNAVADRDILTIAWVALGCLLGILCCSQFLQWLLKKWHDSVMSLMLGFVVGALVKVWPWQYKNQWLTPEQYELTTGQPHWFLFALLAALSGITLVWFLTSRSERS